MAETISVERKGRVAIIRITRPKALNALNTQVLAEMLEAASEMDAD
ncbi:MAG: enoyl-CoA hydratase, partial [Pseudomonadota bacterium]